MKPFLIGVIKERKIPVDRRVVLTPRSIVQAQKDFPNLRFVVESSDIRAFSDQEYIDLGIQVSSDLSACDILVGVKEVPIDHLIPDAKYFMFSHTIKKQPYNRRLLQQVLLNNITLYDHELVTDQRGNRKIGFGYYAGVVGAYNTFRAIGKKTANFSLRPATDFDNEQGLLEELQKVIFTKSLKIVTTGKGRVGSGVRFILDQMGLKEVSAQDFIVKSYSDTVYIQIDVLDYNIRKDNHSFSKDDFYKNPSEYKSDFKKFSDVSDVYIAGHFYGKNSPAILLDSDYVDPNFNIEYIGDISCDIAVPIASTLRASTIEQPFYGYDPKTGKECSWKDKDSVMVMAVDNLPCELPRAASEGFAKQFSKWVLPAFSDQDKDGILKRSKICENKRLCDDYQYLQDYVE